MILFRDCANKKDLCRYEVLQLKISLCSFLRPVNVRTTRSCVLSWSCLRYTLVCASSRCSRNALDFWWDKQSESVSQWQTRFSRSLFLNASNPWNPRKHGSWLFQCLINHVSLAMLALWCNGIYLVLHTVSTSKFQAVPAKIQFAWRMPLSTRT